MSGTDGLAESAVGDAQSQNLVDLLAEAFRQEPSTPAEVKLGSGITAAAYWSFAPNIEVVVARADRPPADGHALAAWKTRLGRRPIPLVLLIESNGRALVVGPSGDPPPVVSLDAQLIVSDLAEAAELDPHDVRAKLPRAWERARGAGGLTGLRNVGLFSTHYLRARGRDLDCAAAGGELPVAALLREMEAANAEWGILTTGDVWRLYSANHPSRTTSFVELDLSKLVEPAYYAALFSAEALQQGGLAQEIASGSRDFAVDLGDRLRERIYLHVVPRLVRAVADELDRFGEPATTREELEAVYDATLTLLYRLLFVLYAEAREFLPVNSSAGYREHSLRGRLDSVIATVEAGRGFDACATDIWSDLVETFDAIAEGHTEWGVPPYDGGLFENEPETPSGRLLARIKPSNAGLGKALYHLAYDEDDDDAGRIDYSDLEIRHLGDVYEGLLQFEADRAREDLAYDSSSDAYVPAEEGAGRCSFGRGMGKVEEYRQKLRELDEWEPYLLKHSGLPAQAFRTARA